jgi:ribosomal protein S27AE
VSKTLYDITVGRCGMEVVREERKIESEVGTEGKRQNSREMGLFCPLCNVFAGRRIRNKLYCGNCGFVES